MSSSAQAGLTVHNAPDKLSINGIDLRRSEGSPCYNRVAIRTALDAQQEAARLLQIGDR